MTDINRINTAATNAAANPSTTGVVLRTLEDLALHVKKGSLSGDMVLIVLDRELTHAGFPSNLLEEYSRRNISSIDKGYGGVSPEEIMTRAGHGSSSTEAVTKALEPHRQQLLSRTPHDTAGKADHPVTHENTAAIHENATAMSAVKTLTKVIGKLSVAAPVISSITIVQDYTQAIEKVQPYVDKKQMNEETARDYAAAIVEGKLEQNLSMGLSSDLGNLRLGQWVKNHPEIPEHVLQELDLGGVRELQQLLSGSIPEA